MDLKAEILTLLNNSVEQIRQNMQDENVNASGRTSQSLTIVEDGNTLKIVSQGENIAPFGTVEVGRVAGKIPYKFADIILQWADDKGITFESEMDRKHFGWAVAFSISKKGTIRGRKNRNVIYTPVVNDLKEKLKDTVSSVIVNFLNEKGQMNS